MATRSLRFAGRRPAGAFCLCGFWLIDALALSGRTVEARELPRQAVGRVNHLGLMSEQFDPVTGEMLGNFPQAFSHIGLTNSLLYLAIAEGREVPEPGADRLGGASRGAPLVPACRA